MAICVENQVFSLETDNTLYQMKVDSYGFLLHLWYGAKTNQDMSYLLDFPAVATCGVPGSVYEAGTTRKYSLNTLPQEYSTAGTGDFRVPAMSVIHGDGSNGLSLQYESHDIQKGKYSIPGLPAVYASEDEAETLHITLKDEASDVRVQLVYGVLPKQDVITRCAIIQNDGEQTLTLKRAHSLNLDIPYADWEWIHLPGRPVVERQVERKALFHGIQESSSTRGTSSHQQNPAVILCEKDCTETKGTCIGAALMYSGNFQTQIEKDQVDQIRLVMGIQPETFSWKLGKGECFYTPEVILSCSTEGLGRLSRQFHSVIRNHVTRGKYRVANRPVLINNWEATYFDFDEEKILNIAKRASELGVDMLVLDDGWFGKRDDDCSGLGDWYVNEQKLKGGLNKLVSQVNDLGMQFGIWFEPEMISEESDLYRKHPEWALKIPGRAPMRGRCQLVLDMSRQDVRDYLFERLNDILSSANITYVKWDMNRSICDWYSSLLPAEQQGEVPHRYVLGLYELLERFTKAFPNVLLEGCCGGGGRFDAGMMYYCPQIWCSDDTDAHERTKIQYGTSFFYPVSTMGAHVSAVPNHQTGRITSIDARGVVAMAGTFGYELDLNKISEEEKTKVAEQIIRFKQYQSLIHGGQYYRLSNPMASDVAAWSFVSPEGDKVLVQGLIYRAKPYVLSNLLPLCGLDSEAEYCLVRGSKNEGAVYTGKALMSGGILLPIIWGDDVAFEFYLEKVSR